MRSPEQIPSSRKVRLYQWLWRAMLFIWGTLVVGIIVGTIANLNTTSVEQGKSLHFVLSQLFLVQLFLSYPVPIVIIVAVLVVITLLSGFGSRDARLTTHHVITELNRKHMIGRLMLSYQETITSLFRDAIQMELGLATRPSAVQPSISTFKYIDQQERILLPHTTIRDVYEQAQHELLILGEPGAGKSRLLVTLAQELLKEAEQDPKLPFPIVLPLSTWAQRKLPLEDWMSKQITQRYEIPPRLSQAWVKQEQILPFLDGLDEMEVSERSSCIIAINTYHHEHPLHPLVVCSRTAAYDSAARPKRLTLHEAVVVLPLSQVQIDAQLATLGRPFVALRTTLKTNPTLATLAMTPLMFQILLIIYREATIEQLSSEEMVLKQQIWTIYVQHMVNYKGKPKGTKGYYPFNDTATWLRWLAQYMRSHNLTIFSLENLQPDILPTIYKVLYYCCVELCFLMIYELSIGLIWGLIWGFGGGVIVGIIAWFITEVIMGFMGLKLEIKPIERIRFPWERVKQEMSDSLFGFGALVTILGAILGLIAAIGDLISGHVSDIFNDLLVSLLLGLIGGLIIGVSLALFTGLLQILGSLFLFGMSAEQLTERKILSPNEGIQRSLRNGCFFLLFFGISAGLSLFVLLINNHVGLLYGLLCGLMIGLFAGLLYGQRYGLHAVVQHYFLRIFLHFLHPLPYRVVPFLNDATMRILLRRVDGGYSFTHRLLLEHFADLDPSSLL